MSSLSIAHHPRPSVALGFALVWFLAATALVWVGAVLVPEDGQAMDGLTPDEEDYGAIRR